MEFTNGNIVRKKLPNDPNIKYVEDDELMCVEHSDGIHTVCSAKGRPLCEYNTEDLELVSESIQEQEVTPIVPNVSDRTQEEIHDDIGKMFVQVAQYMENRLEGETIHIQVKSTYAKGKNLQVSFETFIGYADPIKTNNLFKSAEITLDRFAQNKVMQPLQLSMHKDADAVKDNGIFIGIDEEPF